MSRRKPRPTRRQQKQSLPEAIRRPPHPDPERCAREAVKDGEDGAVAYANAKTGLTIYKHGLTIYKHTEHLYERFEVEQWKAAHHDYSCRHQKDNPEYWRGFAAGEGRRAEVKEEDEPTFGENPDYVLGAMDAMGINLTQSCIREAQEKLLAGTAQTLEAFVVVERHTGRRRIESIYVGNLKDFPASTLYLHNTSCPLPRGFRWELAKWVPDVNSWKRGKEPSSEGGGAWRVEEIIDAFASGNTGIDFVVAWLEHIPTGRTVPLEFWHLCDYAAEDEPPGKQWFLALTKMDGNAEWLMRVGSRRIVVPDTTPERIPEMSEQPGWTKELGVQSFKSESGHTWFLFGSTKELLVTGQDVGWDTRVVSEPDYEALASRLRRGETLLGWAFTESERALLLPLIEEHSSGKATWLLALDFYGSERQGRALALLRATEPGDVRTKVNKLFYELQKDDPEIGEDVRAHVETAVTVGEIPEEGLICSYVLTNIVEAEAIMGVPTPWLKYCEQRDPERLHLEDGRVVEADGFELEGSAHVLPIVDHTPPPVAVHEAEARHREKFADFLKQIKLAKEGMPVPVIFADANLFGETRKEVLQNLRYLREAGMGLWIAPLIVEPDNEDEMARARSGKWGPKEVIDVAANPIYVGIGPFPSVIEEAVFFQAQKRLVKELGLDTYLRRVVELLRKSFAVGPGDSTEPLVAQGE